MLPIYLRLLRRRRLEPPHRRHPRGFPLRPQPVRQDRVAARVATLPQLQPRHPGAPDPGSQPLIQLLLAGIQLARPPRPGGPQTGVPSVGRRYLRTVLRSKPVIEPIAWMQSPCRLSLPMLCKSFPLNRSRPPLFQRACAALRLPWRVRILPPALCAAPCPNLAGPSYPAQGADPSSGTIEIRTGAQRMRRKLGPLPCSLRVLWREGADVSPGLRCLLSQGAVQHLPAGADVARARDGHGSTTSPFGAESGDSRTAARIEQSTPAMEAPARLCGGEYVSVVSTSSPLSKAKKAQGKRTTPQQPTWWYSQHSLHSQSVEKKSLTTENLPVRIGRSHRARLRQSYLDIISEIHRELGRKLCPARSVPIPAMAPCSLGGLPRSYWNPARPPFRAGYFQLAVQMV